MRVQTKRGGDRFRIADLFADERCTEAILEFLESTDVGRKAREEEWGGSRQAVALQESRRRERKERRS